MERYKIVLLVQIIRINIVKKLFITANVITIKKGIFEMYNDSDFFKLLVQFSAGKPVTRKRLLRISGITPELIQEALEKGYIVETTPSDIGEVRYLITEKGRQLR